MTTLVRPELPTAALRSQATHATVDNSASFAIRPDSTYKSGKVVQTTGATSKTLGRPFFAARGEADDGDWCEPSVLVVGMAEAGAVALGRAFGQNAVVVGRAGAAAELRCCVE
jgi:hypothetical protein